MAVERIVVAGGGVAALRTVEALRREGFDGALTMVSAETELPYDRPPLSKAVLIDSVEPEVVYRDRAYYDELEVELLLGTPATSLALDRRTLRAGERELPFDAAVIATGAAARTLPNPRGLAGVHALRTLADARAVRAALDGGPRVVVVGGGPIGSEVAAAANARGAEVTVLEALPTPFARAVGGQMGHVCGELHADHGVRLLCDARVHALEGDGRVERVRLADGRTLDADLVVVGIGVVPNVAWLAASGLAVEDGVLCDATLATSAPGVWAAGDVARWHNMLFEQLTRGEQWTNAIEQARHVARMILAGPRAATPFVSASYFWSDQYGVRIQFAGSCRADEVRVVEGAVEERRFLALYRSGERLVGAFAIDMPRLLMRCKLLIERRASWAEALAVVAGGRTQAQAS